jgi:hypothetical protein
MSTVLNPYQLAQTSPATSNVPSIAGSQRDKRLARMAHVAIPAGKVTLPGVGITAYRSANTVDLSGHIANFSALRFRSTVRREDECRGAAGSQRPSVCHRAE